MVTQDVSQQQDPDAAKLLTDIFHVLSFAQSAKSLCYQKALSHGHTTELTDQLYVIFWKRMHGLSKDSAVRVIKESSTLSRRTCGQFSRCLQSQLPSRWVASAHRTLWCVCTAHINYRSRCLQQSRARKGNVRCSDGEQGEQDWNDRREKLRERMETSSWDLLQINEIIRYNSPAAVTILLYF